MRITGARVVAEVLLEQGCDTVFGYPGGQVIDLYDALYTYRSKIRHILTAHEQGAAHAADGYARASGRVGVVIATSGPGATNLVTGIAAAYLDSVPLVAVTGNVPCSLIGRDSFQEVDIVGITMPVTKHNFIVKDVNALADTLRTAFQIAKSGRPGPVLVDIPKDVQTALTEFTPLPGAVSPEALPAASEEKLRQAAEMIAHSRQPYIYFGGGIVSGGASEALLHFAERIDAPMGCSLMGLSAVPGDHPRFLGMQGMHGHYAASRAEDAADLVIALGVRFSDRATGDSGRFAKHFRILHIDIDNAELDKNIRAALPVRGDLNNALTRLTEMLPKLTHKEWMAHIRALKQEEQRKTGHLVTDPRKDGVLNPYAIIDAVCDAIPDAVYVTDVGQHQMWAAQRCRLHKPRTFLTSGGLGAMGFGLGAAVGAHAATGKRTVLFTGDGSFGMNLTELATAASLRTPVTVIIFNNGVLGMVRQWQALFHKRRFSATTLRRGTDFAAVARGFGAKGVSVTSEEDLVKALRQAASCKGPFVIDCAVDADEPVLPMLPPGGSVDDIITEIK